MHKTEIFAGIKGNEAVKWNWAKVSWPLLELKETNHVITQKGEMRHSKGLVERENGDFCLIYERNPAGVEREGEIRDNCRSAEIAKQDQDYWTGDYLLNTLFMSFLPKQPILFGYIY